MGRILLTGASSGIGLEILRLLLEDTRWSVVALSRRRPEIDGTYRHISCDLSNEADLLRVVALLADEHEAFFGLISCAGVGRFAPLEDLPLESWKALLSVNLTAPYLLTRFVLPEMKRLRGGRLVYISSDADHAGFAGATAYCASKFGLRGFGEALRKELTGSGVTISTVSPGRVDTCFNGKRPGMRPLSLSAADVARMVITLLLTDARCEVELVRMKSNME
jgi:NAD(P)-dependent dehydrogenase (short-subunit alcohol dehydrogenase family)